jgi:hypothetical protein
MVVRATVDSNIADSEGNLDELENAVHGSCTSRL